MSMKFEILTKSPSQTKKIGEALAKEILTLHQYTDEERNQAIVLGLIGNLGGGKTTFLQGFAKGLGIKQRILSPTFILMKRFSIPDSRFNDFYHFDCYRLQKPKEILGLGFKEIISNHQNIIVIEWADRIKKILPKNSLRLNFFFIDQKTRKIDLNTPFFISKHRKNK